MQNCNLASMNDMLLLMLLITPVIFVVVNSHKMVSEIR